MNVHQIGFYSRLVLHSVTGSPSLFVLSYPRSGSSWLSRMLSTSTGIPYGRNHSLFVPQIIHLHRYFLPSLIKSRTAYIVRDVRDVFLSYSSALLSDIRKKNISKQQLLGLFGVSPEDLDAKNPKYSVFVRNLMQTRHVSINWKEHVRLSSKYGFVRIRYEDLLKYPEKTLSDLLEQLNILASVELFKVVTEHQISKEKMRGLPVRTGGVEKWKQFSDCTWVDVVSNWAHTELAMLDYEV